MDQGKFKEKDSENLAMLLNFIAEKAKFQVDVKDTIKFYGLLVWAQTELSKKIKDNILEVLAVHEPEPEPKKPARRTKASK